MGVFNHTMFLMKDGTVKSVGANNIGQLGLGNTTNPISAITTVPITGVKSISCGGGHTVFLMNDGTVKGVGSNQFGQLGLGHTTSPITTISNIPISGVKAISCGGNCTMFLMNDGSVKSVGQNNYGQLGLGNTTTSITTISEVSISGVKSISCGSNHAMFLMNDGTVKGVGENDRGQLGLGHTTSPILAISNVPITGVKAISCGINHTMFLMEDGTVRGVGSSQYGQLGGNKTANSTIIELSLNDVKTIGCGDYYTMFLMEDETVKSLGQNNYGQLGLGHTTSPITTISNVTNLAGVKSISCGGGHTMFLVEDGTVKSVGHNRYGQLGLGNITTSDPYGLSNISNVPNLTGVKQVADSTTLEEIKKLLYLLKSKLNNIIYTPSNEEPTLTEVIKPLTTEDFEAYGVEDLSLIIGDVKNEFPMNKIEILEDKQLFSFKLVGFDDINKIEIKK